MTTILGLFRKPTTPTLIISRPIPRYSEDVDSYCQDEKSILPARTTSPPSNHRLFLFAYATIILLSLTAVILFSVAIPLWNKNFIHRQSPIKTDWPDTLILIPLILSLLSSTYLLVSSLRHHRRHHALDSLNLMLLSSTLLLSLTPALILVSNNTIAHAFSTMNAKPTTLAPNPGSASNSRVCNLTNILTRPCLPVLYLIGELQIGGIVLSSLIGMVWLLVMGLSVRNFMKKRAKETQRKEERRRRRHARRRGHEHNHRDERKPSRRIGDHSSTRHDPKSRGDNSGEARNEGSGRNGWPPNQQHILPSPWEGSNAVRYAQQKIKPNESFQAWLADRRV